MLNRIYVYLAVSFITFCALIPPVDFGILNPEPVAWTIMVVLAGFAAFCLALTKVNIFVKILAIAGFVNCFFSVAPYISFTSYVLLLVCCYFFLLCSKIKDWKIVFKTLQIIAIYNLFFIVMQWIGKDNLLNWGIKGYSCFGIIGNGMQMGTFITMISMFLVIVNPIYFIYPFIVAFFCSSHWALFTTATGLFVYAMGRFSKNVRQVIIAYVILMALLTVVWQKHDHLADLAQNGRLPMWKKSIEIANKRPLTGWGMGSYKFIFSPLAGIPGIPYRTSHNEYVQNIFEMGYPIFFGVMTFLTWLFYKLWRKKELMCLVGLTMLCVNMLVHFPLRMVACVPIVIAFLAYCVQRVKGDSHVHATQ